MIDMPWPKKGDNPFKADVPDNRSPTWTYLELLATFGFNASNLSDAFKTVADKAIAEIRRGNDIRHPDELFMPIAYLYRHSIELKLKGLIMMGLNLELEEMTEKTEKCLVDHNLHALWNIVRRLLKAYWPDGPDKDLNAAEGIIVAFHKIDRSGQNLRYTYNTEGEGTLKSLPESADMVHIQEIYGRLHNMLDSCEYGFSVGLDMRREFASNSAT